VLADLAADPRHLSRTRQTGRVACPIIRSYVVEKQVQLRNDSSRLSVVRWIILSRLEKLCFKTRDQG
jgi:hypothetical protein